MPCIEYKPKRFSESSTEVIDAANQIIAEYKDQGFQLTLRQLYYQFVSRNLITNRQSEYKRLGSIINDARLAGLIDWCAIEDRTRELRGLSHWESPSDIIRACVHSYHIDKWQGQEYRPEVWVEKDALVGVIEGVCRDLDVNYFSCRGYTSQSEMWVAGQRHLAIKEAGQIPFIIHLGDHDPSGIDMTRDIQDRIDLFTSLGYRVERIALTWDQVQEFSPPPNPTKVTDSRAEGYMRRYGEESWELDALEPQVIADLIIRQVEAVRDNDQWNKMVKLEQHGRDRLKRLADGPSAV